MKIKIESAWKTLCDAFPKLKDNPLYKGWYISYAILVTLSILTVVVVNHRIVYSFPFDWFGLLFGIILPWVFTTFYIKVWTMPTSLHRLKLFLAYLCYL